MVKLPSARLVLPAILCLCFAAPAGAFQPLETGIFRLDFQRVDDLLELTAASDVRVLVVDGKNPKAVSDAHLKLTRDWVKAGGVLWAAGAGLESSIPRGVAPYRVEKFGYRKAATGERGGELIVKGVSPRLVIDDHPLAAGVSKLYLFAQSKFDGTQNAEPIVEITDTKGNHGLVLAAIQVGEGYLVLDGTARKAGGMFGRVKGFDKARPNSRRENGTWNSYDWDLLFRNGRDHASAKFGPPAGLTGAPPGGTR